ncbi:nickel transport protein [Pseudooceanicola antarcticus]|uniref:Cobalt ABC transporter permease n=1 Tax=Pseudooceanicola antarcticus TaxID=1247613 RepID=A0A285HLN6_9RHOB|nr:cobalt ABC transporter permease [Pseudooceanicola antarcticus]PJE27836.1 cobalt ABC transporter permease [Pseudooceanicola antarcticus]SNY36607.1 nickel transport protein [Pseudooceanicola antarcticus]
MIRALMIAALCALPLPALAHKVIASVFPSGSAIEGEVGFSNGAMAVGQEVQVFGPDGALLGRVLTDDDGFFLFTPTEPVAHRFRADLGAGHVANVTMEAAEVARILGTTPAAPAGDGTPAGDTGPTGAPASAAGFSAAQQAEIAQMLRDELRPLRREIAAYRERNDLQSILGGIGYIVGLFGLGFYLAARRRLKD